MRLWLNHSDMIILWEFSSVLFREFREIIFGNLWEFYFIQVPDSYLHTLLPSIKVPDKWGRLIKVPDYFQDARIMIEGHPKISMTHDHIILRIVYCMLTYNQLP